MMVSVYSGRFLVLLRYVSTEQKRPVMFGHDRRAGATLPPAAGAVPGRFVSAHRAHRTAPLGRRLCAQPPSQWGTEIDRAVGRAAAGRGRASHAAVHRPESDAGYGDSTEFREELEKRELAYAVGITPPVGVWLQPPKLTVPPAKPMGRPPSAVRYGNQHPLQAEEAARRKQVWLLVEWPESEEAPTKYCLCDLPAHSTLRRLVRLVKCRWKIGVSRQGHIVQSVKDRPGPRDSGLVAWEASWRESKTAEPSDNMLRKECAQRTRLQRRVNADVASLHEFPVAETVDNVRKQQELAETSPMRQLSPAGYQRRHGVKDDVETGEALGVRRRKLVEEMPAITVSGKCRHRRQGGGSGRSTVDGRAAKRARREGPGPVSIPSVKGRQG
jgi:hypothetical protein